MEQSDLTRQQRQSAERKMPRLLAKQKLLTAELKELQAELDQTNGAIRCLQELGIPTEEPRKKRSKRLVKSESETQPNPHANFVPSPEYQEAARGKKA